MVRRVSAADASEWPTDTRTPRDAAWPASSEAPGNSGASVIKRTCPSAASNIRSNTPMSGASRRFEGCAPRLEWERNGPSRWIPTGRASPSTGFCAITFATPASDRSVASNGAETVVARNAPVPRAARNLPIVLRASGVASMMSCPAAPWMCTSKNAGARVAAGKACSAAPDGTSAPVAAFNRRNPSVLNHNHRFAVQACSVPQLFSRIDRTHEGHYCRPGGTLSLTL